LSASLLIQVPSGISGKTSSKTVGPLHTKINSVGVKPVALSAVLFNCYSYTGNKLCLYLVVVPSAYLENLEISFLPLLLGFD